MARASKYERAVATHLMPGERLIRLTIISPSRDVATDLRRDNMTLVVTDQRLLFCLGTFSFGGVHWWAYREVVVGIEVELRWQRSWINKAREYIVTFAFVNDRPFSFCIFAGSGGKRAVRDLSSDLGLPLNWR